MTDVAVLAVVTALVAAAALVVRRSNGRQVATTDVFSTQERAAIGVAGNKPSVVLFTAPGCATCHSARRVIEAAVAAHDAQVATVDVSLQPDLARARQVWRAPTTFVLDRDGRAVARVSGVPHPDFLEASLPSPAPAN